MSGLFDILSIGGSALAAQQRASQIVGQNIANLATPGYRRQDVVLGSGFGSASGVVVTSVRHSTNEVLGAQVAEAQSRASLADRRSRAVSEIESLLTSDGGSSVTSSISELVVSFRELSAAPADPSVRQDVLLKGQAAAEAINGAAADLSAARQRADTEVVTDVTELNSLLDEVATVNRSMPAADVVGQEALGLDDRRQQALTRLAQLIGATSVVDGNGQVSVLVDGVTLVQGDEVRHVQADTDPASGLHTLRTTDSAAVPLDTRIRGGEVGALLTVRDHDLPGVQSQLDQLAFDLATAVNTRHLAGFGLDGLGGRAFFTPVAAVAGAAQALSLDAAVINNSQAIAAASQPAGVPGDNGNALSLAQLDTDLVASGATISLSGAASSMFTDLGSLVAAAESSSTTASERQSTLSGLLESQQGVSLEEQTLLLTEAQRAFQAATRVIQTIDEMLDTLIKM